MILEVSVVICWSAGAFFSPDGWLIWEFVLCIVLLRFAQCCTFFVFNFCGLRLLLVVSSYNHKVVISIRCKNGYYRVR